MSELDQAYTSAIRQVNDMREEEEWQRMLGNAPVVDEASRLAKFWEGVKKGVRETPNVFRPGGGEAENVAPGQTNLPQRVGEAVSLPFTIPFNAITQGLVEAGIITPRTQEQIGKSLMGATPALIGPKPSARGVKAGLAEGMKGGKPGMARVSKWTPTPEDFAKIGRMIERGVKDEDIGTFYPISKQQLSAIREASGKGSLAVTPGPEVLDSMRARVESGMSFEEFQKQFPAADQSLWQRLKESMRKGEPGEVPNPYAEEPAPTEPQFAIPDVELRLNTARINAEKNVKTVMANVNRLNAELLAEHRKPQTHEQTLAKAQKITVEEALAMPEDTAKLPETGAKLRDVATAAATDLTETAKATLAGDAEAAGRLFDSLAVAGEVEARSEMAKRNVARTEEAFKIQSEASRGAYDQAALIDLAARYKQTAGADPVVAAQRLMELGTEHRRLSLARQVRGYAKAGMDAFYKLYVNMLLTPASHAANIIGNTLVNVWAVNERAVAGMLQPITGGPIGLGEAAGMIRVIPEAFVDGLRAVREYGWSGTKASKVDIVKEPALTAAKFGLDNTLMGKMFDYLATGAQLNTTLLGMEDAFFQGFNFRQEIKAQAIREAHAQRLTGEAFRRQVAYVESHPELYPSIYERANEFKLIQTFQDPMGPFGEWLSRGREIVPGFKIVVPFLKTPNRIVYWAAQRTPGLNLPFLVAGQLGSDLMAGGAARQLATAKLATGAAATAAIAYYAASGYITGAGPRDKETLALKKQTGWMPNSIKVGDTYYGYNRLDPFGLMVGAIADFTDIVGHLPEAQADEMGMAFALSFAQNFVSKTYMQGLSDLMESIADPQANAHAYAKNFARGLVPGVVRSAERTYDPTLREASTIMEAMKAQVPGYSSDLPPQRNLFGEPILSPPGWGPDWLSPITVSGTKDDPVAQEIDRVGVRLSRAPRAIYGTKPPMFQMQEPKGTEGIQLTPAEYDYFVRLAGNELKHNGKGMKDSLREIFKTAEYQKQSDGPEGGKAEIIRHVVMQYREAARLKLLQDSPDLREAVETKIRLRREKLQPIERTLVVPAR